jgi:nicotinamidase-related amidase
MSEKEAEMVSVIRLPVRSYPFCVELGQPNDERHLAPYETIFPLPVEQTAFILVDVRTTHFNQGWLKRADAVARGPIAQTLAAARGVGMTIIHAPGLDISEKYAQGIRYPDMPPPTDLYSCPPAWPPEEFRKRKGPCAVFAKKEELRHEELVASYVPGADLHPLTLPREGEFVAPWDGATLRRFLEERKILHLIYVGFATNQCVQFKEYGMRDQARYGYNCILLRDCTTATEFPDTVDGELLMHAAIREIESVVGWTAEGTDFIEACRNVPV